MKLPFFFFFIFLIFILEIGMISATCSVVFTRHAVPLTPVTYYKGETITASMVCTSASEKNTPYQLTWRNSTNSIMQTDNGTTPGVQGTSFVKTYLIPTTYSSNFINATFNGTGLTTAVDNATIAGVTVNTLLLSTVSISGKWLGLETGFRVASITDSAGNKISGSQCEIGVLTNDQTGSLAHISSTAVDGTIGGGFIMDYNNFAEGTDYILRIKCYCAGNSSSGISVPACINSNGIAVINAVGSIDYPFTTNTWITYNEDPYPITYLNGTTIITSNGTVLKNVTYNSGYDYVYWRRNITNNYGQSLKLVIDRYLISNTTNKIVDSELNNDDVITTGAPPVINSYLMPETITSGTYYIRRAWSVYYQGLKVASYTKDTVPFTVVGVEAQTLATSTFVKDRFNGIITTHPTLLNISTEPAYNATDKLFIRAGYNAHWCVNVTNIVPPTNLSVATTVYTYLQYLALFNPTLGYYQNLLSSPIKQYTPLGNSTMCFDAPIPSTEIQTSSDYQLQYEITQGDFNGPFDCPGCSLSMSTDYFYIIPSLLTQGITIVNDKNYPMILYENRWEKKQTTPYGSWEQKVNLSSLYENYIDPFNNIPDNGWDAYAIFTDDMPDTLNILNYTVKDSSGNVWANTELKDMYYYNDDNSQTYYVRGIGIENVNISNASQKYFTVTVYSPEYTKRQTNAQEGINTSLGITENATVLSISEGALSLSMSPLTSITTLGTFKQYETISLIQNCKNSTWSNVTRVTYPNSSFALNTPTSMTKNGFDYNYSYSLTSAIGAYLVYGACDQNGINTPWSYKFDITPTGGDRLNSLGIFIILILFSIALLGMALIFKNGYVGFIAGCLFLVTGVYVMIYGLGNLNDTWTRAVSYTVLGMGLIFCISAGIEIIGEVSGRDGEEE